MEKHILTEINRTREIMGLAHLINEELRQRTKYTAIQVRGKIERYLKKTNQTLPESFKYLQNFAEGIPNNQFPLGGGDFSGADFKFALLLSVLLNHHANGKGGMTKAGKLFNDSSKNV